MKIGKMEFARVKFLKKFLLKNDWFINFLSFTKSEKLVENNLCCNESETLTIQLKYIYIYIYIIYIYNIYNIYKKYIIYI